MVRNPHLSGTVIYHGQVLSILFSSFYFSKFSVFLLLRNLFSVLFPSDVLFNPLQIALLLNTAVAGRPFDQATHSRETFFDILLDIPKVRLSLIMKLSLILASLMTTVVFALPIEIASRGDTNPVMTDITGNVVPFDSSEVVTRDTQV